MNYINIFNFSIPSYSFLIISGIILANILAYILIKKYKLSMDNFVVIEAYGIACGMLGAKILYLWIIRNHIDWSKVLDWNYIEPFIQGGFVFYGGLIGALIGLYLVKVIHKIDVMNYLSKLIFFIPLAHGFGRIGCYLAGCCYGIPYDGHFHVEYHNIPYTLCDVKLFPVQLVESILLFILAIILFYLAFKNKASYKLVYGYLISYSIIRFILEYFRYDAQRGSLWLFSTSQWISLGILLIISIILFYKKRK